MKRSKREICRYNRHLKNQGTSRKVNILSTRIYKLQRRNESNEKANIFTIKENRGDKLTLQKTMDEPAIVKFEINTGISRLFF